MPPRPLRELDYATVTPTLGVPAVECEATPDHLDQLLTFYFRNWWTEGRSEERGRRIGGELARHLPAAENEDRVVGFARILTDGVVYGYIADVMVDPDERDRGLGRRHGRARPGPHSSRRRHNGGLTCQPAMDDFYARFGFRANGVTSSGADMR